MNQQDLYGMIEFINEHDRLPSTHELTAKNGFSGKSNGPRQIAVTLIKELLEETDQ